MRQATTSTINETTKRSLAFVIVMIIVSFWVQVVDQHQIPTDNSPDYQMRCQPEERPFTNQTCLEQPLIVHRPLCTNNSELIADELMCYILNDQRIETPEREVYCNCQMSQGFWQRSDELFTNYSSLQVLQLLSSRTIVTFKTLETRRGDELVENYSVVLIPNKVPITCRWRRRDEENRKGTRVLLCIRLTEKCVHRGGFLSCCNKAEWFWVTTGNSKKRKML